MTISFITIAESEPHRWSVVKNTFPKISGTLIQFSSDVTVESTHASKKIAKLAAKEFAKASNLHYIKMHTSVMTICKVFGSYSPVKLSTDGEAKWEGDPSDLNTTIINAWLHAVRTKLIFISPELI